MRWAAPASLTLHATLLAWLLIGQVGARMPPAAPPPIEVELVRQDPAQQGAPQATTAAPPPAAPTPMPAPDVADRGEAPPPSPPAPQARPGPPAPPAPQAQAQAPAPAVNLGNAERDLEGLVVTGDHVVPPAPDAAFRNQPPRYPADAARRGAEGTVQLLVRVSAQGVPDEVVVAGSSGTASLDRAAQQAVRLWHFRPAIADGMAVPFEYRLNVNFRIGNDP